MQSKSTGSPCVWGAKTPSDSLSFVFRPAILTVNFRQFLHRICLISTEIAPATDPIGIEQLFVGGLQGSRKFEGEIAGGRKVISDIRLRPRQQPCPVCNQDYSA